MSFKEKEFYELIDEFSKKEQPILRANASQDKQIREQRKKEFIFAYNKLVKYTQPAWKSDSKEQKQTIKDLMTNIHSRLGNGLKLLESKIKVPEYLDEEVEYMDEMNDDNAPSTSKSSDNTVTNTNTDKEDLLEERRPTKKVTMSDNIATYLSSISKIISNTFKGDPNGLKAFTASIELALTITTQAQQDVLFKFIKTKLEGKALEAIPQNASTAKDIIDALERRIKPDESKVVIGRLLALRAEKHTLQKFQTDAEALADQLRRSYISEGMTEHLAEKTTIEKTVEMCRLSARTNLVKSVLASSTFHTPKEVLAKLVTETTTESGEAQVMYFGRNTSNRQNFRGNSNQRENYSQRNGYYNNQQANRSGFQNQQFNRNGNFNNFRGRNKQFRGNRRGNSNGNWRQNDNRRRQHNGRVYYAENVDAPPPGAQQRIRLNQAEHDEY